MADTEAMSGKLYGLGVGPGDPELMTVKAWRLVSTAPVIAYLAANGEESTARAIAKPFIPEDVIELSLPVPMRLEREPAQKAYDEGAARIAAHLKEGRDVVMLCEGDPFFYGSFMYLFARLAGTYETIVVPGVTSITASAAAVGRPLAGRDEVLKILPATLPMDRLREELQTCQSAAIIKVGRHFGKVKQVLSALDMITRAVAVEKATREDQVIRAVESIEADALPYFTTIIVRTEQ
jgi:precorrin-2/cobalt-factor-2 C20-methyltransferase